MSHFYLKPRVGVLTLPLRHNYGGLLQFIALQQLVSDLGCEVVLLDYKTTAKGWKENLKKLLSIRYLQHIERFKEKHVVKKTAPLYSSSALLKAIKVHKIDVVVVGSDQVWQERFTGASFTNYFFSFLKQHTVVKIAYAASFGTAEIITPLHLSEISEALENFKAVSVREDTGISILQDVFGCHDSVHVLDPTLLHPENFYTELFSKQKSNVTAAPKILGYLLDVSPDKEAQVKKLAKEKNEEFTIIDGHPKKWNRTLFQQKMSVENWLEAFSAASFVVTDSYHGMIFAILFKKSFFVLVNKKRGATRFESLARQLKLENRLCYDVLPSADALPEIDYTEVFERLEKLRVISREFLSKNLPS